MTPIVIVFIAATPIVLWFLRRRTKLRGEDDDQRPRLNRSKDFIEEVNSSTLGDNNPLPNPPPARVGDTKEELDSEDAAAHELAHLAQPDMVSPFVLDREIETPRSDKASGQELSESYRLEATQQMRESKSDKGISAILDATSTAVLDINPVDGSGTLGRETARGAETPSDVSLTGPIAEDDGIQRPDRAKEFGSEGNGKAPAQHGTPTQNPQRQATDGRAKQETASASPEEEAQTADQLSRHDLYELMADGNQAQQQEVEEQVSNEYNGKGPSRYRPPVQRVPKPTKTRRPEQQAKTTVPSDAPLEILIRLTFDRFGFGIIGLLPVRQSGLDAEIDVKNEKDSLRLVAQEDWYQDIECGNIGECLRRGVELKGLSADNRHIRWLLRGRDVYVLASHPRASGFVSTTRLAMGRSHIVFCVVELIQQVEAILNEAGCRGYTKFDESNGVPSGWIGLRDVVPTKAIPVVGSDPFYAIKPAPDIEIELEGGVCLRNSVWLAGYPPRIKLYGASDETVNVLIDGQQAQLTGEGSYVTAGYDLAGPHSIYCEGLSCSRSYSIVDPPDAWVRWPAYQFGHADICGPLVELRAGAADTRIFTVPMSNPLLIGAEPGQVFWCSSRRVSRWKGFVPFDVVWALPAQPLNCDKKTARVLQFADSPVKPRKSQTALSLAWCNAILDASRKGLQIEKGSPEATAAWAEYKKMARNIRRRRR